MKLALFTLDVLFLGYSLMPSDFEMSKRLVMKRNLENKQGLCKE